MPIIYPAGIDNSQTLPVASDNVTVVQASVFNTLRTAVLAIETTLGVSPQGVYGNIAGRLAALESSGLITFSGDISGNAYSQTVIGLQNIPVSNIAPSAGQVLAYNGTNWVPTPSSGGPIGPASGDLRGIYPNPVVASITGVGGLVSVITNTHISFGTNPSTNGLINFPNTGSIQTLIGVRNAANSANVAFLRVDGSNNLFVGGGVQDGYIFLDAGPSQNIQLAVNGAPKFTLTSSGITVSLFGTGIVHSSSVGLLSSSAVNLASADVTGVLPTGNQANQTMLGDVTGTTGASVVAKIQTVPVSVTAPTTGQALVYSGSQWAPGTVSGGGEFSVTLVNGLNSNVATNNGKSVIRVTGPTTNFSIDGFDHAPTGGEIITVINTTAFVMSAATSTGSTSGQRVQTISGYTESTQVRSGGMMQFTGDGTASPKVWILTSLGYYHAPHISASDYADPTGVAPAAVGLQLAINTAIAQGLPLVIDGVFAIEQPLFITSPMVFRGVDKFHSIIYNNSPYTFPDYLNWNGPVVVVAKPGLLPTFTTDGQGVTFETFDPSQNYLINFSKAGISCWGAYAACTFQFYINPLSGTLADDETSIIFSSFGISEDGLANSYNLNLNKSPGQPTNSVYVSINTNNGPLVVWAYTVGLPANTKSHILWSFDGTSLRLFVNGIWVGTASGTPGSTILVSYKEDFALGHQFESWPNSGLWNRLQNTTLIGDIRIDSGTALTYNTNTNFTPPTGPLTPPPIGFLIRFGPSFCSTANPQWAYLTLYIPNYSGQFWYSVDQVANNILSGVTISDLHLIGSEANLVKELQEGIRLQQVYNSNIEHITFDSMRSCVVFDKNCILGKVSDIYINSGGVQNSAIGVSYCNGITLMASGLIEISSLASTGSFNWGILTNGGGVHVKQALFNYLINGLIWDAGEAGQGAQPNASTYEQVEWDDEGSSLSECVCMFGYKTSVDWNSGDINLGSTTSPPVHATIRVQACTNLVFRNTSITAPNSTNGYVFQFLPPNNYPGVGFGAKQTIPVRITNQGLTYQGHWIDPSYPGEIILEGQETSGFVQLNFASNAAMSVSYDNFLNRVMQFTDTGAVLTGTTVVKLPSWWIREREIVNFTAQSLTIQGPLVPSAWASSTQYAVDGYNILNIPYSVTHGGYTYACTTAIASSTTAPTATAYSATNTDGSGVWTCYGLTQTITVTAGTRVKIWSDGVQWWLS